MKRILGLALLSATWLLAVPNDNPAKTLYDSGISDTREGRLERARLTLQTLVNTYPKDPLALQAKGAIDATLLFEEGESRAKAGRVETAKLAFETLIAVYPENPLAERAKAALGALEQKEKKNRPVVKDLEFRDVAAIPDAELRDALAQREVRLCVGRPYDSHDVEQAKSALEEILAERGMTKARIQAQTHVVQRDAVDVVFTVEKTHGSLLGTPWRLASSTWHHVRPGDGL